MSEHKCTLCGAITSVGGIVTRPAPALPADVQAVVERVSDALTIVHPIEDLARLHYDSPTHPTENVALYAPIAMEYVSVGDIRTLLAHLQRQDNP